MAPEVGRECLSQPTTRARVRAREREKEDGEAARRRGRARSRGAARVRALTARHPGATAPPQEPSRAQLASGWALAFTEALETDSWGQVEEALEAYSRLRDALDDTLLLEDERAASGLPEGAPGGPLLSYVERVHVSRLALGLRLRCATLSGQPIDEHGNLNPGLADMKRLAPAFEAGLEAAQRPFPLSLRFDVLGRGVDTGGEMDGGAGSGGTSGMGGAELIGGSASGVTHFGVVEGHVSAMGGPKPLTRSAAAEVDVLQELESPRGSESKRAPPSVDDDSDPGSDDGNLPAAVGGTLLGPPRLVMSGARMLTITVNRIGLKDAADYIDPFMTVSVCDGNGQLIEGSQDTPLSVGVEGRDVLFGFKVHIQTPLNELRPSSAIFLEFKHWKPTKRKISTRCWSLLEMDELRNGAAVLEVYKKPTDFKKRLSSMRLLSVKPLYMQLQMDVRTAQ